MAKNSGVYIHIPFCIQKCLYCDFNSHAGMEHLQGAYVNALIDEIKKGLKEKFDTVFIGGGTPTALPLNWLLKIIETVRKSEFCADVCEFTVEANPATVDFKGLLQLRKAGVNRISIGLQSANDDELKVLGRIHDYSAFLTTYAMARDAGFDNINVDLMFSLPNQTKEKFKSTLEQVINLSPEHISCYSLIVEENTPFSSMDFDYPTEDEDREMYLMCVQLLREHGYEHYEISNFCKPGFYCKHNLKYWDRVNYYGFGAGAHSLIDNVRFENTADIEVYTRENRKTAEVLSRYDIEKEFIFLGLRKMSGISLSEYKSLFGQDFLEKYEKTISKFKDFSRVEGDYFRLNIDGISVSNTILSYFML
ncbi:MAG: radical SAM family heme chaperone HemW [Eubacteriales bacterium]|nr:radical SAM family heme chaperone HemW [Eubacteriales bacterium]